MKKIVIYPERYMENSMEILQYKEPAFFHSVLWIIFSFVVSIICFMIFGHIDEVIKSNGIVRPECNISSVNNITSGEIESLFYKPGEFVNSGQKLLAIKGDALEAQRTALNAQFSEVNSNVAGLQDIIRNYEIQKDFFEDNNETFKARYEAFLAEKKLLTAKVQRMEYLYNLESELPESSTTKSNIESLKFDYEFAELELNEFCKNFISGVRQELDSLKIQQENLNQQLKQIDISIENLMLVSPIAGYVQEISSLNPGDYIFSDQKVLNIVPCAEKTCRIELHVPAEKMGKLEVGQKVKLRFPAFPYSEYKGIDGTLQIIQPDSQISNSGALFFTVYADVNSMELRNKKGISYQIKPGFEVNARIILENQSLMYFLLKKLDFTV